MRFHVERIIEAPRAAVWDVMADFGNTADWNTGLTASRIIAGPEQGVGAERQCDFASRRGTDFLRERITSWDEGDGYALRFTRFPGPFRSAVTFRLEGDDPTTLHIDYWYQGRGMARPLGPLVKPLLQKAIRGYARDLAAAAERAAV